MIWAAELSTRVRVILGQHRNTRDNRDHASSSERGQGYVAKEINMAGFKSVVLFIVRGGVWNAILAPLNDIETSLTFTRIHVNSEVDTDVKLRTP